MASESKRMNALRGVMNKTVDSYLSKLVLLKSLKNIDNKQFKPLHDDIINQLENNIKTEFEHIYKEENIEQLLYGIDQMVAKDSTANKDIDAWRPSGDPYKDTLSEMAALKKEKLKVLLNNLSQLEAQNKLLQENVKKRETHLLKTRDKIVSITENMQEIVDTEKSLVSADQ